MKKLLSTTLTLLLVIGLGTSTLKAEEKPTPKHSADTGVIVTFGEKIDVIDPDNPNKPDKDKEVDPGDSSAIQIWKVPGELKFSAKRSNKNQVVGLTEENAPAYGVFDFHSKNLKWSLFAKLGDLTDGEDNKEKLVGAKLQWKGNNIKRVTINSDDKRVEGEAHDVTGLEDVQLVTDGSEFQVMKAFEGVSHGNNGHFEGEMTDLKLVIPAFQGNPNTTYTGTIKWTLGEPVITEGE